MAAKIFITICVQVILFQTISSQSIGNAYNPTNINPGLIDGSLSAIDIAFGPNEMPRGPITTNEIAYGPRVAANEMAYGPRAAANEISFGPRVATNEMAYGPRIAVNEMAYAPRIAANEMAYGPKSAANEIALANMPANGLALGGLPFASYAPGMVPSSGGSFPVTSSSRIAPTGITIVSENTIEGIVAVNGELPVLAAVSLQGSLPTSGSGSIAYSCGNGAIGIVNEGVAPVATELAYGQRVPNEMDLARLGRGGCAV